MKSICFFNKFKSWGGGEKWHYEAANFFLKNDYKVSMICHRTGELQKRIRSHKDIPIQKITGSKYAYLNIFTILKMVIFFRRNKVDTIIFNSFEDVRLGGLAAKLAGVKVLVYRSGMPKHIDDEKLENFFQKNINIVFTNSLESKQILEDNNKFLLGKVQIIKNGVDFTDKKFKVKPINDPVILGNTARLDSQKDQKTILNALKLLKEKNIKFKFFIAGSGELEHELLDLKNSLDLEEVEFLGFLDDCDSLYEKLDIFILSSIFEGSSNSMIEAMSHSNAIVASNIGSNLEIIDGNKYGITYQVNDYVDLFEKLYDIINDKNELLKLKKIAFEGAKMNYDYGINMKDFEEKLLKVHK